VLELAKKYGGRGWGVGIEKESLFNTYPPA